MGRFFVGVDISKDSFSAAGLDVQGNELFAKSYPMDFEGFREFLGIISSHSEDLSGVWVAMESTGCYHVNLFSFLSSQGIQAVVVNPLLISNFAKRSLGKTKTDKKDAQTIGKFLTENHKEISQLSITQDL
jgi:transposase